MTKFFLVTILITITLTAYSQRDCLESLSFDKRMKRAFIVDRKIGRRAQELSKAQFDEYLKEPNNFFERLTNKRNKLIFRNCEQRCSSLSRSENFKEIRTINASDSEHTDLFDNGVVKVEDLVNCSGCERNYKFYHNSWDNDNNEKTLEILEYRKLKTKEDGLQEFEIWVRPNNYDDLGLVYFIKILDDKSVCIIPAIWTQI